MEKDHSMKTQKRDYYEVLEISRNATAEEIKKSFRKLAKQYHPDTNKEQGTEGRFIEINEAYEVLSDQQKRAAYDRYGHVEIDNNVGFNNFADDIANFYHTYFANDTNFSNKSPQQGSDIIYEMTILFAEAVFGCQKEIEILRWEVCSRCQGNGAKPGTSPSDCSVCKGTGEIRQVQQSMFGQFINVTMCEECHGQGRVITVPCEECYGEGRVRQNRHVLVNIPAGVDNGIKVRVTGQGEVGPRGNVPGNLYVDLTVKNHPFFKRQGNNIFYEHTITFTQAALGGSIEVPTVNGKTTEIKIPVGIQTNTLFKLKGMGVPVVHSNARGDQHILITIKTPTNITTEQKRLLEEFARLEQSKINKDNIARP